MIPYGADNEDANAWIDEDGTIHDGAIVDPYAGIPYSDDAPPDDDYEPPVDLAAHRQVRTGTHPPAEPAGPTEPATDPRYAREVEHWVRSISARREAQRIVDTREAGERPAPVATSLAELLAEDIPDAKYRIDGLWPSSGKVLITAPKKSGKTTAIGNLIRCLADGAPFLAAPDASDGWRMSQGHAVNDNGRNIFLLDFEMTRKMLQEWLSDHSIGHPERIHLQLMRGERWDPRNAVERGRWADLLRSLDIGTLIIDPIGPVMHALGIEENSNTEVGNFLAAIDQLVAEAGIDEHVLVHHTGHEGERARGASALLGWPDATWQIVRGRDDDEQSRYFMAEGRDVDIPETALVFDRATRRLWLGHGNRRTAPVADRTDKVAALVEANPGVTKNDLCGLLGKHLGVGTEKRNRTVDDAVAAKVIHYHPGPNRAHFHYAGPDCDTCRPPGDPG